LWDQAPESGEQRESNIFAKQFGNLKSAFKIFMLPFCY
jgi:hypothetical protein